MEILWGVILGVALGSVAIVTISAWVTKYIIPKRIRINKLPSGEDIPIHIRQNTVGLILRAKGPFKKKRGALTDTTRALGKQNVYLISTRDFLRVLWVHDREAHAWFAINIDTDVVAIEADECEEIK
jgi:hypothetical protein